MRTLNTSSFVFVLLATSACSGGNPAAPDTTVSENISVVEAVSTDSLMTDSNLVETSSASGVQTDSEPAIQTDTELQALAENTTESETDAGVDADVDANADDSVSNELIFEENVAVPEENITETLTPNTTEISAIEDETTQQNTEIVETNVAAEDDRDNSSDTNEPDAFDSNIDLTGVVYTDTETELFWTRSDAEDIVAYLIKRDNNELATLDALSFYDNTVEPGTTYEYTVQAVKNNEEQGTASSLFLTTPEAAPTINESNAVNLIAQVIPVIQGIPFSDIINQTLAMEEVLNNVDGIDNGFTEQSAVPGPDGTALSYSCESGGTAEGFRTSNALPSFSGTLNDCAIGFEPVNTLNGDFRIDKLLIKLVSNPGVSTDLDMRAFSLTDTDGSVQSLNGDYGHFPGANTTSWSFTQTRTIETDDSGRPVFDENGQIVANIEPFTYLSPAFEGRTQIFISEIQHDRGRIEQNDEFIFRHALTADFSMQSPATGNKTITVTTPVEFLAESAGSNFTSGQLLLTASDGSELLLDANTGDANTVLLSVLSDGMRVERTVVWADAPLIADIHNTPSL